MAQSAGKQIKGRQASTSEINHQRDEFLTRIATMRSAQRRTKSHHLKRDYEKAIRKMEKELKAYDMYQRQTSGEKT